MINYGDIYTDGESNYKIIGVANDIIFISAPDAYESTSGYYSKTEFLNSGFTYVSSMETPDPNNNPQDPPAGSEEM